MHVYTQAHNTILYIHKCIDRNTRKSIQTYVIPEMSRPGSGTVHASSNVAASHLLSNYLT